jgi:hypothetical protein
MNGKLIIVLSLFCGICQAGLVERNGTYPSSEGYQAQDGDVSEGYQTKDARVSEGYQVKDARVSEGYQAGNADKKEVERIIEAYRRRGVSGIK